MKRNPEAWLGISFWPLKELQEWEVYHVERMIHLLQEQLIEPKLKSD
jgi:hypothetical protein